VTYSASSTATPGTTRSLSRKKTAFITPFGAYRYTKLSFGLKNAGSTYQRAIQACFKKHLNKNAEAYVDDVVVKIRNSDMLIVDLDFRTPTTERILMSPRGG
jgi:hypothetical protein